MRLIRLQPVFILLAIIISFTAYAETQNPILVTATRLDTDNSQLPASITVITADDIANSPAATLPELLSQEAGVLSRSLYGNNAARATIDIRGFGAASTQNTLILLDGRRLNDIDLSAVDYASIPVRNIERIEIIRGSGGVLYGDGAVGGVINIITRKPGKSGTRGNVSINAGSYEHRQLDATVEHVKGPLALNIYANTMKSDGYRDNNDFDQKNLQAALHYSHQQGDAFFRFGVDDQALRLPGVRTVDPGSNLDQLTDDRRGTNTPNDFAERNGYHASLGVLHYLANDSELTLDAGYRFKNDQGFFDYGGGFSSYLDTDLGTWSLTPRWKNRRGLFGMSGTSVIGVDYYYSQYDSGRAQTTTSAPIHQLDISQASAALYVHNTSHISDNTSVSGGLRYQQVETRARDSFNAAAPGAAGDSVAPAGNTDYGQHALELGLTHKLGKHLTAFGAFNRGFRIVTVDEMFSTFPGNFTFLKPQTSKSVEAGIRYKNGNTSFQASAYRMHLNNEIHYDVATFSNVNLDPTKRYGVELAAGKTLTRDVTLKANYTYMRSIFRAGSYKDNDVPVVPTHTAGLVLNWTFRPDMMLSTSVNYTGSKRFDNDQSNTFASIPAFTTVDFKLGGKFQRWKFEGRINNAFDKKAFDYGVRSTATAGKYNAYPLPQRNFMLSIQTDL